MRIKRTVISCSVENQNCFTINLNIILLTISSPAVLFRRNSRVEIRENDKFITKISHSGKVSVSIKDSLTVGCESGIQVPKCHERQI